MAQEDPPDNVVRFPREWFGSTDDLVPVGADDAQPVSPAAEEPPILAGSSFWTGDSWALQDALEAPTDEPGDEASTPPPATRPERRRRAGIAAANGRRALRLPPWRGVGIAAVAVTIALLAVATVMGGPSRTRTAPRHPATAVVATSLAELGVLSDFTTQRFASHRLAIHARVTPHILRRTRTRPALTSHHHQPTATAAPTDTYVATTAPSDTSSGSYTTRAESTPAAGSTTPVYSQADVTQPAFGATGALGPGHSPNG